MKRSLEMPVTDERTYRPDRVYKTPVSSVGGPKIVLDTVKHYVGKGYV